MKIVHFADLHLDSAFAWCGAGGVAATKRRQALRDTLVNITKLVREVDADALFCGGDLYEHDRITLDTANFLRQTFDSLRPIPVYIAPGNHDWYGPSSLYATGAWGDNVTVFDRPELQCVKIAHGITLWGAAHFGPANTDNFLDRFKVDGPGAHIALFHGAEESWFSEQGTGKEPYASFDARDIDRAGLHHAFLGHYHRPKDADRHTYPGNPDPLQFGEDGVRGPVVACIGTDGSVTRDRRRVAITSAHEIDLDVSGFESQQDLLNSLRCEIRGKGGVARLNVSGDLDPDVDLSDALLGNELYEAFDAAIVRYGDLRPAYDFDAIAKEPTVRGQFVKDVRSAGLALDEERRILATGLRALDGRADLKVL